MVKFTHDRPRRPTGGGGQMCTCTLSLTLALNVVAAQHHIPAALALSKRPGTLCTCV
jgi:hypothetical protein